MDVRKRGMKRRGEERGEKKKNKKRREEECNMMAVRTPMGILSLSFPHNPS